MQSCFDAPVVDVIGKPLSWGHFFFRSAGDQANRFGVLVGSLSAHARDLRCQREVSALATGRFGNQCAGDVFTFFAAFEPDVAGLVFGDKKGAAGSSRHCSMWAHKVGWLPLTVNT